jgi:hypothetical protein
MSALADRLRRRGVDPGPLVAWAVGAGYVGPLDGLTDHTLDGLVASYRDAVGAPAGGQRGQDSAADAVRKAFVEVMAERATRHRRVLDAFPMPPCLAPITGGRP